MSKRRLLCPTCGLDLNDKLEKGWMDLDCPQCGQGVISATHAGVMLRRLYKQIVKETKKKDKESERRAQKVAVSGSVRPTRTGMLGLDRLSRLG